MKKLFIEAKYTGKADIDKINLDKLPKRIGLVSAVQFVDLVDDISVFLKSKNKISIIGKGKQKHSCQVLGCDVGSAEKIKDKVDAFLYVGDGSFHPIGVALRTDKPVFVFNPCMNHFYELPKEDIENYKRKRKGALLKFLSADNVGILVSTKPGQHQPMKKLEVLEKKYPKKKFYTFVAETIDINQLENFGFIEAWINTACPRLEEDYSLLNISELK